MPHDDDAAARRDLLIIIRDPGEKKQSPAILDASRGLLNDSFLTLAKRGISR